MSQDSLTVKVGIRSTATGYDVVIRKEWGGVSLSAKVYEGISIHSMRRFYRLTDGYMSAQFEKVIPQGRAWRWAHKAALESGRLAEIRRTW